MTAEEHMSSKGWAKPKHIMVGGKDVEKIMVEFAQYHVKKALQAASENVTTGLGPSTDFFIEKDSILNAYPESNIV